MMTAPQAISTLREWIVRLWHTVRPQRSDADLEAELRSHRELEADARGRGPQYSGVVQATEAMRDQRGLPWLDDLRRDLQYGARMLKTNPGFTTVAVLSLAIGVGANCAVFSFADALLLRPLNVPDANGVVTLGTVDTMGRALQSSYPDFLDIRRRATAFESVVAFSSATVAFSPDSRAASTARIGLLVSANFFDAMRVPPAFGRTFRDDEERTPGASPVIVLSHELWTRAFDRDPSVIGRVVRLNAQPFTIVGVAAEGFAGLDRYTRFEFYAPLMTAPALLPEPGARFLQARDIRRLTLKGRLKPGTTIDAARAELTLLGGDLERTYPETNRNRPMTVRTEFEDRFRLNPSNVTLIAMLAFLSASVLFVSCANVAGLLASRAPIRGREVALRLAIGAGRRRIVRQLITESLMIAVAGGMAGVAAGYAGVVLFRQFRIATDLPIEVSFRLDQRALAISFAVSVISAVGFGLVPALRAARSDLTAVMKASDTAGYGGRRRGGPWLVGGQVAIAVVLLGVALFIYRDFAQRLGAGPGFRRDHLLGMWLDPSLVGYTKAGTEAFYLRLPEGIRRAPGVEAVTLSSFVPTDGGAAAVPVIPEGYVFSAGRDRDTVWSAAVDANFLETFGVRLVSGRGIAATDRADTPLVAVINEHFARRYWPGESVVGKRFRLRSPQGPWVHVVGVVATTVYSFLLESPIEFVYFPLAQRPQSQLAVTVRTAGDPAAAAPAIRAAIASVDANQPIYNLRTIEQTYYMRVVSILNVIVRFVAAMGLMGLILAIVGLYGLVSYAASRRTKEIGIRMAIGADRDRVLRLILGHGMFAAGCGLAIGLLGSIGAARAIRGIFPSDTVAQGNASGPVAFAIVTAIVLAVTMIAAYLPARRAARINPTEALRHE